MELVANARQRACAVLVESIGAVMMPTLLVKETWACLYDSYDDGAFSQPASHLEAASGNFFSLSSWFFPSSATTVSPFIYHIFRDGPPKRRRLAPSVPNMYSFALMFQTLGP